MCVYNAIWYDIYRDFPTWHLQISTDCSRNLDRVEVSSQDGCKFRADRSNHCPTEAIHQIQVVGDHTASTPRFGAHQQATAYPAMSNTPQNAPLTLVVQRLLSHLWSSQGVLPPALRQDGLHPGRVNVQIIITLFLHRQDSTWSRIHHRSITTLPQGNIWTTAQFANRHGANVLPTYRRPLEYGGIGVVGPAQVRLWVQPTLNNGCVNVVETANNQHILPRWPHPR